MQSNRQSNLSVKMLHSKGRKLINKQKFDQAVEPFRKITEIDPADDVANYSLGRIFLKKNDLGRSIQYLERSFSLSPSVEYARNLGDAYMRAERFGQAADRFKFILNRVEDDEDALGKFAECAFQEGERWAAAKLYAKLIVLNPHNPEYKSQFIRSLIGMPRSLDPTLQAAFAECLQDSRISCSPAIDAWYVTVNTETRFKAVLDRLCNADDHQIRAVLLSEGAVAVLNDRFVYLGVEKLLYPADLIENALRNVRRAILHDPFLAMPILRFVRAAAIQIYQTDYALAESLDETREVDKLLSICDQAEAAENAIIPLLILACYRPLHLVGRFREQPGPLAQNEELHALIKLQVSDALNERALKSTIPAFGTIKNAVSEATRGQYEENPCPRWNSVEVIPQPRPMLERTKGLEILNAGCGTGLEAANAAQTLKTSNITAIDLSLSSLAYGKRKAAEAGIENIDFLQGDFLDIGGLDKSFDLILSSGVLHHMEDPQQGLDRLASVLRPTGSRCWLACTVRLQGNTFSLKSGNTYVRRVIKRMRMTFASSAKMYWRLLLRAL